MKVTIDGKPQYISQLLVIMAWIENCKRCNRISEFKVRMDNVDSEMDLKFTFDNREIQRQFSEFLKSFEQYSTAKVNPIFYVGSKFNN